MRDYSRRNSKISDILIPSFSKLSQNSHGSGNFKVEIVSKLNQTLAGRVGLDQVQVLDSEEDLVRGKSKMGVSETSIHRKEVDKIRNKYFKTREF